MLRKKELGARNPGPGSSPEAKRGRGTVFTIPGEKERRSDRNEEGRLAGAEGAAWGTSRGKGW